MKSISSFHRWLTFYLLFQLGLGLSTWFLLGFGSLCLLFRYYLPALGGLPLLALLSLLGWLLALKRRFRPLERAQVAAFLDHYCQAGGLCMAEFPAAWIDQIPKLRLERRRLLAPFLALLFASLVWLLPEKSFDPARNLPDTMQPVQKLEKQLELLAELLDQPTKAALEREIEALKQRELDAAFWEKREQVAQHLSEEAQMHAQHLTKLEALLNELSAVIAKREPSPQATSQLATFQKLWDELRAKHPFLNRPPKRSETKHGDRTKLWDQVAEALERIQAKKGQLLEAKLLNGQLLALQKRKK